MFHPASAEIGGKSFGELPAFPTADEKFFPVHGNIVPFDLADAVEIDEITAITERESVRRQPLFRFTEIAAHVHIAVVVMIDEVVSDDLDISYFGGFKDMYSSAELTVTAFRRHFVCTRRTILFIFSAKLS